MGEVTCDLRYSPAADAFLLAAAGGTLAVVMLVPFPEAARAAITAWIAIAALAARARLRRATWLRIACDGGVELREGGVTFAGRVAAGSFVAPWLTIVNWRPQGAWRTRTLVLLPGMVGNAQLRNIRVMLRWA